MATLKYPIGASNGGLVLTVNEGEAVVGALKSALLTNKGERIIRPQYGSVDNLFELISNGSSYVVGLEHDVDASVTDYPDLATQAIGSIGDDGQAKINLLYSIDKGTTEALVIIV